jgi:hypothetical protein
MMKIKLAAISAVIKIFEGRIILVVTIIYVVFSCIYLFPNNNTKQGSLVNSNLFTHFLHDFLKFHQFLNFFLLLHHHRHGTLCVARLLCIGVKLLLKVRLAEKVVVNRCPVLILGFDLGVRVYLQE